jgi:hypothetical protein
MLGQGLPGTSDPFVGGLNVIQSRNLVFEPESVMKRVERYLIRLIEVDRGKRELCALVLMSKFPGEYYE